jgi:hypothetical protein
MMNRRNFVLTAPLALAACSGSWATDYDTGFTADVTRKWRVREVLVTVPETLSVSETNSFAPNADIVWHGEAFGDRRKQVAAIVQEGIALGARDLRGPRQVTLSATLEEFHAVTPAALARAPSAVHNIAYYIQVFDSRTLQPLTDPIRIQADLPAYTQAAAIVAAQEGQTQKVRIISHLARVTQGWLGIGEDARGSFTSVGR